MEKFDIGTPLVGHMTKPFHWCLICHFLQYYSVNGSRDQPVLKETRKNIQVYFWNISVIYCA